MLDQVSYQEQILLFLQPSFFRNPVFVMLLAKASMGGQWVLGFSLVSEGLSAPLSVAMAVGDAAQPQDLLGVAPVMSSVFPSFTLEYLLAVYLLCARWLDGDRK